MKDQDKTTARAPSETDVSNMTGTEFKVMILTILLDLRKVWKTSVRP